METTGFRHEPCRATGSVFVFREASVQILGSKREPHANTQCHHRCATDFVAGAGCAEYTGRSLLAEGDSLAALITPLLAATPAVGGLIGLLLGRPWRRRKKGGSSEKEKAPVVPQTDLGK